MRYRALSQGFALPTVVITSVIMFAILVAAVGVVSSTRTSLNTQFYEGLATDAAESGTLHANRCLEMNNYVSSWSSNQLHPNTSCSGGAACTNTDSCFVVNTTQYRSSYTVDPVVNGGGGVQTIKVTGTVELVRSSGVVWDTFTKILNIRVGAQIASGQVAMGYQGGEGAFFATVGKDGSMRTAGYNTRGQLGNGTTNSTLIPTSFLAPTTYPIVSAYTSFLSVGYDLFGVDSAGDAYGAGRNDYGQVGSGSAASVVSTPQKVILPAGVGVRAITLSLLGSYFIGTDNNVYASGGCAYGMLGNNYTISGCSNKSTPVRVNLPTPNTSNANTIPADIVSDRYTTYVRMLGGAVYGWGDAAAGELAVFDNTTPISNPVKIGTFGDSGKTAAVQVVFDGGQVSILDNAGNVYSAGGNQFGSAGNRESSVRFASVYSGAQCLENTSSDGATVGINSCNMNAANQLFQLKSDKTVYNASKNVCLYTADGTALTLTTCSASNTKQQFVYDPVNLTLKSVAYSTKCLAASSSTVDTLATCSSAAAQNVITSNMGLQSVDQTSITGKVIKIWTDQASLSMLTDDGEIWSAGLNPSGQFGDGTTGYWYPTPVKFNSSTPMVDLYQTNYGVTTELCYQNLYGIGNDGRVYGAGGNCFGQLGNGTTSTTANASPVVMGTIDGTSIAAANVQSAYGTTVITTSTGSIYTVGNNGNGQLGDGTTNNRSTPVFSKYINPQGAIAY